MRRQLEKTRREQLESYRKDRTIAEEHVSRIIGEFRIKIEVNSSHRGDPRSTNAAGGYGTRGRRQAGVRATMQSADESCVFAIPEHSPRYRS